MTRSMSHASEFRSQRGVYPVVQVMCDPSWAEHAGGWYAWNKEVTNPTLHKRTHLFLGDWYRCVVLARNRLK
jgi:hypothetical protein